VIKLLGDKARAKKAMKKAGVPMLPGSDGPVTGEEHALKVVKDIGYPIIVKAVAGGGGRGMRVVRSVAELANALRTAQREAEAAFGNGDVYIEKYLESPRHIEFQIIGDHHGNVVHLGERECSIQRRHQKIVEESPSPVVSEALRARMAAAALAAARSVRYVNAGTVEFLLSPDGRFYFLEMNTRLQVEHAVTEAVYGIDIVQAQMRIAAGEPLWIQQHAVVARGHAIECRICAEDPAANFVPCAGTVTRHAAPHGPGIRVDTGIADGSVVPVYYDPLIAKLTTWAEDRDAARRRMLVALGEYRIEGITTNIDFLRDVIAHRAFADGQTHTGFIAEHMRGWQPHSPARGAGSVLATIEPSARALAKR
jgi:acetyl-CoA carboxylase biotin carboxylase subunit